MSSGFATLLSQSKTIIVSPCVSRFDCSNNCTMPLSSIWLNFVCWRSSPKTAEVETVHDKESITHEVVLGHRHGNEENSRIIIFMASVKIPPSQTVSQTKARGVYFLFLVQEIHSFKLHQKFSYALNEQGYRQMKRYSYQLTGQILNYGRWNSRNSQIQPILTLRVDQNAVACRRG